VDDRLFARLESHVGQGRLILFTGAGFSLGASNGQGQRLPTVSDLTRELWEVAFPGEPYEESSLQDLYEAALVQAKRATVDLLRSRLTVDPGSLSPYYRAWFSLPWHRIYTVNIDDLADAANRAFDLPRSLEPLSALTAAMPQSSDSLPVVHMNGRLGDLPDVTFGGRQYAERLASPDIWYANVGRELIGHPFLFVGTSLDEPPLWQYVEARGTKSAGGRELRPGSYLVTPHLARARAVALRQYQIDLIEATAESFEADVLRRLDAASKRGFAALRSSGTSGRDALIELTSLVDDSVDDEREFLLGREPRWSDITDGFAVERDFDRELLARVDGGDRPSLVIITGTAGAGKSASAMRLTLALNARGERVVVLNHEADLRSYRIRHAVDASSATVLFIDDLDRLGGSAKGVVQDVQEFHPDVIVIAALRSTRYDAMGLGEYVAGQDHAIEAVAPPLSDPDIDGLLDALNQANRLGVLKNQPRAAQRAVMAQKSGRQLLVAMIEATSGVRFDEKVESECRELAPEAALVYGVVALATY
jgi:hypothetical protein